MPRGHGGRLYRSRISRVQPLSGPIVLRRISKTYRSVLDLSALSPATRDVLKAFGVERRIIERAIIRDLDLEIRPDEIVAVTGISGAGKTTLLRILIGGLC